MTTYKQRNFKKLCGESGFSMLELTVAALVLLILGCLAVPNLINMLHSYRLTGAVNDFSSLMQIQRLRAVGDDRYYSSYVLTFMSPHQAFVDIYPQNLNGSSGTGGTSYTCGSSGCDPIEILSAEVSQMPASAAPSTSALQSQFLPASSPVTPKDGSSSGSPITFGPTGLPCAPTAVTGGTVCDSAGGQTAYWTFFQDSASQEWGAVTITPAGRIQRWVYSGGSNGAWANF